MSKKIALHIEGRQFDVDVGDDFASFLQTQMQNDFNIDGNNKIKTLLHAYVRKSYELFEQEKKIKTLLKECESLE